MVGSKRRIGLTADLRIFKLCVQLVWPAAMPAAKAVRTKVFLTKCEKGVAIRAGMCYNLLEDKERGLTQ